MQEIIQNADDAGAKTVKFFIDSREHGTTSLVHPDLAPFQGPALLAYNDAQFRDEDWEGIQNLQRSVKAEDPFKVGKFGIGFNSVYHITGTYFKHLASAPNTGMFDEARIEKLVVIEKSNPKDVYFQLRLAFRIYKRNCSFLT